MELSIPVPVLDLMERLEDRGFEAWAVGGCVRDRLLGLAPHDWDLCTDALPGEIAQVFEDFPLVRAGEKHGTIAVVTGRQPVEITTFRTEGGYRDHRRPDWVHFEKSLREDLARRDFTINAMAYNPHRGLADPFGGQADLADCILRAVGEPEKRFQEDGLRILRGVRFAARFHLTPEPRTLAAMTALAPTLNGLARERIFGELCGFLPALNLVGEKERGTIEQINVTPVGRLTFTLAKLIPYWIIGLAVLTVAMSLAWLVYGLTPVGAVGAVYLAAALFIVTMSGLGVAIANRSDTMQQTMFVMFFFVMIFVLMSGLITPIASMPGWAQAITRLLPPRYFIGIMRAVYLKGTALGELWGDYAALAGFALVFGMSAILTCRKRT